MISEEELEKLDSELHTDGFLEAETTLRLISTIKHQADQISAFGRAVGIIEGKLSQKESTIQELQEENTNLKDTISKYDFEVRSIEFYQKLEAETDRLNRIMPHTGETCKNLKATERVGTFSCLNGDTFCGEYGECVNKKWELKG